MDHVPIAQLLWRTLDKCASSADEQLLEDILQANAHIALPFFKEILEQSLEDGNGGLQQCSAFYLSRLGKAEAVEILLNTLHDERFQAHYVLFLLLGLTKDIRVLPALLEALDSDDNRDSDFAQSGLREMGTSTIPAIVDAFHNGNAKVRKGAVERLGAYPTHPLALPTLIEAVHDSESRVREIAANGLGRFHYKEAVQALLELIHDQDAHVRYAVYTSLIILDPLTALKVLLNAVGHSDENIRKPAVKLLISDRGFLHFGKTLKAMNWEQFYHNNFEFKDIASLTSISDIMPYLSSTEAIYKAYRSCDVATAGLKAIYTSDFASEVAATLED